MRRSPLVLIHLWGIICILRTMYIQLLELARIAAIHSRSESGYLEWNICGFMKLVLQSRVILTVDHSNYVHFISSSEVVRRDG